MINIKIFITGIVATDHSNNLHLYQYVPHSDGKEGGQVLRTCATYNISTTIRSTQKIQYIHPLVLS